jgi:hypothetical protein
VRILLPGALHKKVVEGDLIGISCYQAPYQTMGMLLPHGH